MPTTKSKTQTIKPLADVDSLLTADDLKLWQRREKIKAELAKIEKQVKPRIKATIDAMGEGAFDIDGHRVELKRGHRDAVSWQSLATALLDQAIIDEQKPSFTVTHDIDSIKVVG